MDWPRWLRDFALAGTLAAAVLVLLRSARARDLLGRARDAVAAWTPRRALVVVLLATALPRLAFTFAVDAAYETDVREYVEKAEAIAEEGTPRRQEVRPDGKVFYRSLGSALPLAGWYRATGTRGLLSARLHTLALACVAAWLVLALGRAAGRVPEARLAALGYALLAHQVVFATLPYSETFVTVLVLGISVLHERLRRGTCGRLDAPALGLLGGWLAITRPELAWVAPLSAAIVLWERRPRLAEAAAPLALAACAFLVLPVVNHRLRDGYPGLLRTSSQSGLILYFGNNPTAVSGHGNADGPDGPVVQHVRELYARDPTGGLARDEALAWMRDHPGAVLANAPKKAFHLWLAEPQGLTWHLSGTPAAGTAGALAWRGFRVLAHAQSLLVLALGLLGWRLLGPERRLWGWTLALHLAVWCVLAASARNRYPLEPWLLLAAAAWVAAGKPYRSRTT